jgi:putative inorganic carbon (HCO3(-)) transporter
MGNRITYICTKTVEWSLVFIIAAVPLIINPAAFDLWYRPKISSVQALLLIAGMAWLTKIVVGRRGLRWQWTPLTVSIIFYAATAILSTVFSINTRLSFFGDSMRLEGLCSIATYLLLVFLFVENVQTPRAAEKLFFWLLLCASLVSMYALFQYFCYNPTEHFFYKYLPKGNGVGSTIGNPNFLGKFLVLIIPIILALCLGEGSRVRVTGLFFSFVLCFAALMATFTRASWLGLLVGMTIVLFYAFQSSLLNGKGRRILLIGLCLFFIVLLFNIYTPSRGRGTESDVPVKQTRGEVINKAVKSLDVNKGRGVATRLYVWDKTVHLIRERPWFGYGPDTFMLVFKKFNQEYTNMFHDRVIIDRAHNNYLDTAFAMGLSGLAAYLAILVSFLLYVWRLLKNLKNRLHRMLFLGILAGFCGYLINDLFIFSVVSVSPTFWSLMGLTVATGRLVSTEGTCMFFSSQKSEAIGN